MSNRIAAFTVLVTALSLLVVNPLELDARGGGRGGGGGSRGGGARTGGRAYQGGHTMNRTPTMSRAAPRPVTRSAAIPTTRPTTRPATSQARQRPQAANRGELRNQVQQYAQSRPAQNFDRQALPQRSNQINQNRQLLQSRPGSNQWFNRDFFDHHNLAGDYLGARTDLWRPAAWATLAGWGAWNWSTPYYYDGGYAYAVPSTEYTTTAYPVAASPAEGDWLPLGVFAVAQDANAAAYTNHFIQLAVNRNGEIAGVFYNSATDAAQDLTGMVDPVSQQAYWSMANRTGSPIAYTGIYNLTQDQTTVNVHFADGTDQVWTLVRLQQGA